MAGTAGVALVIAWHAPALFPWSVREAWWLAPLALALDLWLGDPALPWPHPVCLVGRCLARLETPARRLASWRAGGAGGAAGRLAGMAALALVCGSTGAVVLACVSLPVLGGVLAVYFAWAGLAFGCLLDTGAAVGRDLESAPPALARLSLSRLVSREVKGMDRQTLRKTLADTLSENFTDAFMAPFFWLLVAGPVGLWLYKAVSTADSMWGYLTPRWRDLGWAGARADDALAWLPARLSVLALGLADVLGRFAPGLRPWHGRWPGLRAVRRQARGMPSPNSGWSMTACAWLCGARMAGPSVYFGERVDKAWLGPPEAEAAAWDARRLAALCALMRWAALCGGAVLWGVAVACAQGSAL